MSTDALLAQLNDEGVAFHDRLARMRTHLRTLSNADALVQFGCLNEWLMANVERVRAITHANT